MSNYQPVMPTGARPPRPGIVSTAGYLLYVVAALFVATSIVGFATVNRITDVVTENNTTDDQNLDSAVKAGAIVGASAYIVVAILFVVLAVFVMRGNNGMRITTWVIAGIGALCTLCGSISNGMSATFDTTSNFSGTSSEDQQMMDALPGWAHATSIALDVLILIALCLVIIFLALPSSNVFFRKVPPIMIVGYPGYGAQPGYPGYPSGYPQPSQPTYPGQPAYPQPSEPVYPPAPAAPPAPPSPWALPGGQVPPQQGPVDGTLDSDPTRADPNQS